MRDRFFCVPLIGRSLLRCFERKKGGRFERSIQHSPLRDHCLSPPVTSGDLHLAPNVGQPTTAKLQHFDLFRIGCGYNGIQLVIALTITLAVSRSTDN